MTRVGEPLAGLLIAAAGLFAQAPDRVSAVALCPGKSLVIDSPGEIRRVAVGNPEVAEIIGVSLTEILLNGKHPGETSVVVWTRDGKRAQYDIVVSARDQDRLGGLRRELARELEGQTIEVSMEKDTIFLRGTVRDLTTADRAMAIASSFGKTVNLLRVNVPAGEAQILLKVRFADIDRTAATELGANWISTGAGNTIGTATTGQFSPPRLAQNNEGNVGSFVISDLLNVFLFRPDLNLGVTLRLLQQRKLLEILAEPNLLATNGKAADFLAGGEFPYPVVQGMGGMTGAAVSIVFKEFGIRLRFLPVVTPRGTIRLTVEPEVSALDYSNGLTVSGFSVPALSMRRVRTEVELEPGQSFGIAGLLDNRLQETLAKVPGLGDLPLLGKLFQSRAVARNNTELLVVVTPEIVRPLERGAGPPGLEFTNSFLREVAPALPQAASAGAAPPPQTSLPVEVLKEQTVNPASEKKQ